MLKPRLGVTVMPEYIQSEGADAVLDNLARIGATSVTTSPYVARETARGIGLREPPSDAGAGQGRLLDRPLWGKDEVWMTTSPSFVPDPANYDGSPYRPDPATDLTRSQGGVIGAFLTRAKQRGFVTYLQVMAAIPPGLRVQFGAPLPEDQPMTAAGAVLPVRVDRNATLASDGLRRYMRGLIRDLCREYPACDGIRFDWPEYPPYDFRSLFADYNPQVAPYAATLGLDLDSLAKAVVAGCPDRQFVNGLRDGADLETLLADLQARNVAFADHFRLRRHLTDRYAAFLRAEVDLASGGEKTVFLQGFPWPWNLLSGFDPAALSAHAQELAVKFYTMHWPMIGANYVRHGAAWFGLSEAEATVWFRRNFIGEVAGSTGPLAYPDPDTPHGIAAPTIAEKMRRLLGDGQAVAGISHSYGPIADVVARFEALHAATGGRLEINRYAYMSDGKIDALAAAMDRLRQTVVAG